MRAPTCLNAHNTLRRQRLRARKNELVLLGVNVVGDHVDVVDVPEPLAQGFSKGGLAGADRSTDPDAQRAVRSCANAGLKIWHNSISHERKSLVYCVSCAMEARSSMNAADPRSSIVDFPAPMLVTWTACSSSAIASCPS